MNIKTILAVVVIFVTLIILSVTKQVETPNIVGSVSKTDEYKSVVTATGLTANKDLIKLGEGTLGSLVITGAGAGTFELYDATTTNATLRTITATSSLTKLASFPANATAGTYTFDTTFYQGLIIAFTGAQGTTTLTYR